MTTPSGNSHSLPLPGLTPEAHQVCDAFEAAWKAAQAPRIEDYLGTATEPGCSALLRELLGLDLDYRRLAGDTPTMDEYQARFPEHRELVRDAFAEEAPEKTPAAPTTVVAGAAETCTGSSSPQLPDDLPENGLAVPGYEIFGELGRGGMGVVYKARQIKADRLVALKMILAGGHADQKDQKRFQGEVEAIARLQHPNIVQIFEVGEVEGKPFFSLEFAQGGSLAHRLDGTPLPAREAALLLATLARAMDVVHQQGIVHRDLKPANVLLSADGQPKISDFGLAKQLDSEGGQTASGAIVGTPSYMAPEQAGGKTHEIGPAADVYALGAILYECLTGRPPFKAATVLETLGQVRFEEPVPPGRLQPGLPRDVETVCLKCLEKDPSKRYATAGDLAADLRRFLNGEPIRARPVGRGERAVKWARRRPATAALLGAAVLAVVSLAAAGWWYHRQEQAAQAEALVRSLAMADIGRVPKLVEDLAPYRRWADPLLRDAYAEAEVAGDSRRQLHVSLALLPTDPGQADYLFGRLPDAAPSEVIILRQALEPHQEAYRERLWETVERPAKGHEGQRLRAACALAVYDPDSPHWDKTAATVVAQLVAENPVHFSHWLDGFRPVKERLRPSLETVFRDHADEHTGERTQATNLLAEYAKDQPDVLADLLADADPKQYAVLFPLLQVHRERAVALFHAELDKTATHDWKDGPLDPAWVVPDAALVRQIEAAEGLVAERFAFCQTLPLAQFDDVAERLRRSGYRPINFRPYAVVANGSLARLEKPASDPFAGTRPLVAAVWTRDGGDWQTIHGVSAKEVQGQDIQRRKAGYQLVDVAGYLDGDQDRYIALWMRASKDDEANFYVGISTSLHRAAGWGPLRKAKFNPVTHQVFTGSDGEVRYSSVWRWRVPKGISSWNDDEGTYTDRGLSDGLPVDVSLMHSGEYVEDARAELLAWLSGVPPWAGLYLRGENPILAHPERRYAGAFQASAHFDHAQAHGLTPEAQRERARDLARQGYRPVGLSVAAFSTGLLSASVWHRPIVPDEAKERLAKRQANAAVALLGLGQPERIWPLLIHQPDPRLRSYLIHRLSPLGADARSLVKRLAEEPDVSAKRALLLCLGEFGPEQLPPAERAALISVLVQLYRDNPDPGLHAAATWNLETEPCRVV